MKRKMLLLGILGPLILLLGGGVQETPAGEPAKPQFTLKLMGINRAVTQYRLWEEWAHAVEARANGRVKFAFTSLPELGLGGAETIRITKTGIVDVAEFYLGYVAGELPITEMLEIPGIFPDQEAMKQAFHAWRPHMEQIPFTPEIQAAIKEVLRTQVVAAWVKRAGGPQAAQLFNQIVAPLVGFTVAP